MTSCQEFRARLAAALARGASRAPDGSELALDAHVAECDECRTLLAASGADPLDRLLDVARVADVANAPPEDLGRRTLDRLAVAREFERLDRLLERVPAPQVPSDLARRVLARVARERRPSLVRIIAGRLYSRRELLAVAAILLVLAGGAWRAARSRPDAEPPRVASGTPAGPLDPAGEPTAELLASLDLLEDWELLVDEGDALDLLIHAPEESEVLMLELERWSENERAAPGAPAGAPVPPQGKG